MNKYQKSKFKNNVSSARTPHKAPPMPRALVYKSNIAMDELFQNYTKAFDSLDASAIASLFTSPCSTSDGDGSNVFINSESLIGKFEENCSSMKSMGYQSSEFNILNEIEMGETAKAVNIGWRVITVSGAVEFRSLYICHKNENSWLIFSANVYQGAFNDTYQDQKLCAFGTDAARDAA